MRLLKLRAGFTLVELIIVMGMSSIFVVVLTDIFVSLTATKLESEATAAVTEDGRFILSRLAYDIERASNITTPENLSVNVTTITSNSATITWQTSASSDSQVEYGTTTSYGNLSTINTSMVTSHSINLSGLTGGTTYQFRVISKDASGLRTVSSNYSFQTSGGAGAIAHIQSAGVSNDNAATTIAQGFSSNVTQGNLLVAAVSYENLAAPSCADSLGNSYSIATFTPDGRHTQSLAICYTISTKSGGNTITATFTGSSAYRRIIVNEYSGIAATNSVDVTATNVSTATTATNNVTSNSTTTTQAGDLIYGVVFDDDASLTTITSGTGFTSRRTLNNFDMMVEDQTQSSAGSIAATFTFAQARDYMAHMVAFKAASVPAGATPASLGATSQVMNLNIDGNNNQYKINNGDLILTNTDGSTALNSSRSNISDLSFQLLGKVNGQTSVKIQFTLTGEDRPNQGPISRTYTTTVGGRK